MINKVVIAEMNRTPLENPLYKEWFSADHENPKPYPCNRPTILFRERGLCLPPATSDADALGPKEVGASANVARKAAK